MPQVNLKFTGTSALLMHNSRLADPLDPFTKQLKQYTSKKTKTESDHENMAHLEFLGGAYFRDDIGLYIPSKSVRKMLIESGRKIKIGKQFESGLFVDDSEIHHSMNSGSDLEAMYANPEYVYRCSVVVSRRRVMRTRLRVPMPWSVDVQAIYDEEQLNKEQVVEAASRAGQLIGIMEERPLFGRFNVECTD